jgi:hypothetical protein
MVMNIPIEDIDRWRARLDDVAPSAVLREMADVYAANKSSLGFMLADFHPDVSSEEVQAVWAWDIARNGKGLSDSQLDEILSSFKEKNRKKQY